MVIDSIYIAALRRGHELRSAGLSRLDDHALEALHRFARALEAPRRALAVAVLLLPPGVAATLWRHALQIGLALVSGLAFVCGSPLDSGIPCACGKNTH